MIKVTSYEPPKPGTFSLTGDRALQAEKIIARYPQGREASATIPLLDLAQRENAGWLSTEAMDWVAQRLDVAPIRVYEVASFYSMFNTKPVGRYFIQVCRTTPCWLRGSDSIAQMCKEELGIELGETTEDGMFTLVEVECLGACANAPMAQVNDSYYEDLTPEGIQRLIVDLRAGKEPAQGPQTDRQYSAPAKDRRTLLSQDNTATEKTGTEKTGTEKTGTEKTATEKTATEKTATEKTATEKTATEKTATEGEI